MKKQTLNYTNATAKANIKINLDAHKHEVDEHNATKLNTSRSTSALRTTPTST
jgi:hypothetical protein